MATVCNDPNGTKQIQFIGRDQKRSTIRLGKVSRSAADTIRLRVEDLVKACIMGTPLMDETVRWLAEVDDTMIDKLAAVGLTTPRSSSNLDDFLTKYITARKAELKPASIVKLEQTKANLLEYFPADKALRSITEN